MYIKENYFFMIAFENIWRMKVKIKNFYSSRIMMTLAEVLEDVTGFMRSYGGASL